MALFFAFLYNALSAFEFVNSQKSALKGRFGYELKRSITSFETRT
jgi:hypothetical protein